MLERTPEPSLSRTQRALDFIEARLDQPLTVAQIAAAVGLSSFHFARLFTATRGESVMAYVWRRRLQRAAGRIAEAPGAVRLIDLALDCGFDSQEAFTRAFKRLFGVAPGQFKRAHLAMKPPGVLCAMTDLNVAARITMRPKLETLAPFRVAGLSAEFRIETRPGIPLLWERFLPRLPFPGMAGAGAYGVCWDMHQDQPFKYLAGAALEDGAPVPAGLDVKEIPAQSYLVFRQEIDAGPFQAQVTAAMEEIWGRRMPNAGYQTAGGPDFEYYPPGFAPMQDGWVEYWIPVSA